MRRSAQAAAVLLLIGGPVLAARQAAAPGGPPAAPPSDIDITFKQQANLTPQEMVDQGKSDLEAMQGALKRTVELQELARRANDIIKLNCVNDKLLQVKAAMNISEQSMTDLHEAIARNDDGARAHAFTKVTIAKQKVQVLVQEGENCVGQDLSFIGETQVTTEIVGIPEEDPTVPGLPPVNTDRPPEASPFI